MTFLTDPNVAAAVARAELLRPGELGYDIHADQVILRETVTGHPFAVITADGRLRLTLRQGDAERAHAELGGSLSDVEPGITAWEVAGADITTVEVQDRVAILLVRALTLAMRDDSHRTDSPLGLEDLVEAITQAAVFAGGPTDMQLYWTQRRSALMELFGCAGGTDLSDASLVVESVASSLAKTSHPLHGWHEWSPDVGKVTDRHASLLSELEEERQRLGRALISDLLRLIHPGVNDEIVTHEDLAAQGIAPNPPRDEMQMILDGDW